MNHILEGMGLHVIKQNIKEAPSFNNIPASQSVITGWSVIKEEDPSDAGAISVTVDGLVQPMFWRVKEMIQGTIGSVLANIDEDNLETLSTKFFLEYISHFFCPASEPNTKGLGVYRIQEGKDLPSIYISIAHELSLVEETYGFQVCVIFDSVNNQICKTYAASCSWDVKNQNQEETETKTTLH